MAPVRLLTHRQLEILVEFTEQNHKDPLDNQSANKAWGELAKRLNSLGEGLIKSPEKWKRYWHLLKCRTKAKAADDRRHHDIEKCKLVPLTDLEKRLANVIGSAAVERTSPQIPVYSLPQENEIDNMHKEDDHIIIIDENMYQTEEIHEAEDSIPDDFPNRTNFKNKQQDLFNRRRRLYQQTTEKQKSLARKCKNLALEKMEMVELQKELLRTQLLIEVERLEHNRFIQKIEMKDAEEKYAHNKIMRNLEFERFDDGYSKTC